MYYMRKEIEQWMCKVFSAVISQHKKCQDYDSYFFTYEEKTIHIFFIKLKISYNFLSLQTIKLWQSMREQANWNN